MSAQGKADYSRGTVPFSQQHFCALTTRRVFCWREPDNPKQSAVESINKEIECDSFVKWIQAKSAQEHEEMGILEKVEAITAKHRQEDIERQEKWNWRNFRWMVIAVGAAIISAIAAIFPELLRSAK